MITETERELHKKAILKLDRAAMAKLRRFAPDGHIFFADRELSIFFENRFQNLGGMDSELSKSLGWTK
jgi:hypothetical protein